MQMQVPFDHVQGRLSTPCAVLHPIDEDLSMGAPVRCGRSG
jgi:hypothetical protein